MRYLSGFYGVLLLLPSQSYALEPDQVYAKVAPSIVTVVGHPSSSPSDISFGSGVVIAPGQVITNCHVVEGSDVLYLKSGKHTTIGIIRFADPDRDLCQIGATDPAGFDKTVSHIDAISGLRVGQKVYAIGAPQGLELTLSDGLIASLRNIPSIGTIIQTSAPISKGSSGGGLFDSTGRLIGITSFTFKTGQNLNFAIPASWIAELPERYRAREQAKANKLIELAKEEEAKATEAAERKEEIQKSELEKRKLGEEQKREEAQHRGRETGEAKRNAEAAAHAAKQKAMDDWKARIQNAIKSRVVLPPNIEGNPETRFEVVLLPGGEVLNATLKKSSGNPAYDTAVERAINRASPLPVPSDTDMFQESFRELTLVFRPKDSEAAALDEPSIPDGLIEPKRKPAVVAAASPSQPSPTDERGLMEQYRQIIWAHVQHYVEYPAIAKRRRMEGTTVVLLTLAADGKVSGLSVLQKSGYDILDEAAMRMLQKALPLPPAPEGLRGHEQVLAFPVRFGLTNEDPAVKSRSSIAPWISDSPGPGTKFRSRDFSTAKGNGPPSGDK